MTESEKIYSRFYAVISELFEDERLIKIASKRCAMEHIELNLCKEFTTDELMKIRNEIKMM